MTDLNTSQTNANQPWRKFAIDAAARKAKAKASPPAENVATTGKIYPAQAFNQRINPQNPSWAGYRPRWLCDAEQPVHVTPENFKQLRTLFMYMSVEQCAAFLRVAPEVIEEWESGQTDIPCAAYLALRLVDDVQFLPHQIKEWADWKIIPAGVDVGMLYNTRSGEMFSPQEVASLRYVRNKSEILERERQRLQKQVSDLEAENTRLRAMFLSQGVTKELHAMQDRLSNLITSINTAQVIDMAPAVRLSIQPKEAAA